MKRLRIAGTPYHNKLLMSPTSKNSRGWYAPTLAKAQSVFDRSWGVTPPAWASCTCRWCNWPGTSHHCCPISAPDQWWCTCTSEEMVFLLKKWGNSVAPKHYISTAKAVIFMIPSAKPMQKDLFRAFYNEGKAIQASYMSHKCAKVSTLLEGWDRPTL